MNRKVLGFAMGLLVASTIASVVLRRPLMEDVNETVDLDVTALKTMTIKGRVVDVVIEVGEVANPNQASLIPGMPGERKIARLQLEGKFPFKEVPKGVRKPGHVGASRNGPEFEIDIVDYHSTPEQRPQATAKLIVPKNFGAQIFLKSVLGNITLPAGSKIIEPATTGANGEKLFVVRLPDTESVARIESQGQIAIAP